MAILYKPFKSFRTAFCTLLAGFFLISPVYAQTGPYVVENITVDVSANNAITARNQAFEKAQQEAIVALASQFLDGSQVAAYQPPPVSVISPMVQDFEVTKEKLSKQRYIGTYTFRFKPTAVRQYFSNAAIQIATPAGPAAPVHESVSVTTPTVSGPSVPAPASGNNVEFSRNLLILPFMKSGQQTVLWSGNGWMQAWQRASLPSNQVVPIGDLTDVSDIGDDEALNYDTAKFNGLLTRYSASEAAIVIAEPDAELARAQSDTSIASGELHVSIYRTDRSDGPEQAGQISVVASGGETRGRLFDRAVRQVQQTLMGEWRASPYAAPAPSVAAASASASTIEMRVPFANLQEWAKAQRMLNGLQGVNDIVLKSLTPREARIGVVYNGNADTLRIALQQAGMDLSQGAGGVYDLYVGGRTPAAIIAPSQSYQPLEQVQPLTGLGEQPDILPPDAPYAPSPQADAPYSNTF